jgi:hypothetical protein
MVQMVAAVRGDASDSLAEDLKLVLAAPEGSYDQNRSSVIEHHVVTRL